MIDKLSLDDIQYTSIERSNRWHVGGVNDWSVADWALAMAGEAGEVCNAVKKLKRVTDGIANENDPGRRLTTQAEAIEAIGAELADTVLYAVLVAARCGLSLEACVVKKFNATSERYGFPERLSSDAGDIGTGSP